jgi:DNA-binding CsgD family transcriptional regulator
MGGERLASPRELEIATMASRGLSSKAIAERLVIYVRTVDNTLRHAYAKLSVSSRAELRPLLYPSAETRAARTPSSRTPRPRIKYE